MTVICSFEPELPPIAIWHHIGAQKGIEIVSIHDTGHGYYFNGQTNMIDVIINYSIFVDTNWNTRTCHVVKTTSTGTFEVWLKSNGSGFWFVNGEQAVHLNG